MGKRIISNELFFEHIKEILALEKSVKFRVRGKSMHPFLKEGDFVLLKCPEQGDIRVGKIVLASFRDRYILHRVMWSTPRHLYLAGEGNYAQVEKIREKDVVGVVLRAFRANKKLDVDSYTMLGLSAGWFVLRPMRRLANKLIKSCSCYEVKK